MSLDASVSQRLTIEGALAAATARLARAGHSAPRREAVQLVAALLDVEPAELLLTRRDIIDPDRRRWIDDRIERRAAGEPLAYVTGVVGFRHLTLRIDRRALIPRPETEGVVDRALALCPAGIAVDIGTGSGCLALALAQEGRYRRVIGIDPSRAALALARQNQRRTGLAVELCCGDLQEALADRSVDLLVSNPPYITNEEHQQLDPAVRDYEPDLALLSGEDGLDHTRRLLTGALRVLRPSGWLVMELAADRAGECRAMAVQVGWQDVRVSDDLFGRPRYLVARQGSEA